MFIFDRPTAAVIGGLCFAGLYVLAVSRGADVAAAAHEVLIGLYPAQAAAVDTTSPRVETKHHAGRALTLHRPCIGESP